MALIRALGEDGAGRFLQIMAAHAAAAPGPGAGDYTAERHRWADRYTVEELAAEIMAAQEAGHLGRPPASCVDSATVGDAETTHD